MTRGKGCHAHLGSLLEARIRREAEVVARAKVQVVFPVDHQVGALAGVNDPREGFLGLTLNEPAPHCLGRRHLIKVGG